MSENDQIPIGKSEPPLRRLLRRLPEQWELYLGLAVVLSLAASALPRFAPSSSPLRASYTAANIDTDPATGRATSIRNLENSTTLQFSVQNAGEAEWASVPFLLHPDVSTALGVQAQASLRPAGSFADPQKPGYYVVRLQQYVGKVRLFGADIAVSMRSGPSAAISSVAARPGTVPVVDMQPAVDQAGAQSAAAEYYASIVDDPRGRLAANVEPEEAELVLFDPQRFRMGGEATLAWRARVASIEMLVNAHTRRVIIAYDTRHSIRNRLTSDCGNTQNCRLVLTELGAVGAPVPPVAAAVEVHDTGLAAHGFFRQRFGRDGYDDPGGTGGKAAIEAYVRVGDLENAQWNPWLLRFEFGDGWTTGDVAAHEYVHAVTQFGPGLTYLGESGAVNEFFSDFFGAMIDRSRTGRTDWLIGEGVKGFSSGAPIRDMANPNLTGFDKSRPYDSSTNRGQPDHYSELVTTYHPICSSLFLNDNGCVHFNSGILNKAAVLAIDGGTFRGTTVTPIATDKVEQIFFRTWMLGGVTSASGLKETADGAVTACSQLIGAFGITSSDCQSFTQALVAVGLQ